MAILNICEFAGPSAVYTPLLVAMPPAASQDVAIGAESAQSDALNAATALVRLCADTACYVALGSDPTAAAEAWYLPADVPEYVAVPRDGTRKIAVIAL